MKSRSIFIHGNPLFGKRSGVGQYEKRLLDALIEQNPNDSFSVFAFLFAKRSYRPEPLVEAPNLHYRYIRYLPGRVYNKLVKLRLAPPVDLMLGRHGEVTLWFNFVIWPTLFKSKHIVVIHDLSYIHHAKYSDAANNRFLFRFVPGSIKKAAHILTVSEHSKTEIIDYYHVAPERITVVSPGINEAYAPQSQAAITAVREKMKLNDHYILFAGTIEPRKNILGVLNAYANLEPKLQQKYQLVLAGGKGWLDHEIMVRFEELKELNIVLTGYVDDGDFPALFSGASVFVFPSHYEGFGMPPLEAMACGIPVIAANNSSLPEVIGDAGILVEAYDTAALSAAIARVLTQPDLAAELSHKGLVQAQKYTWDKSARLLRETIERIAG